ncbi:MAG: DUF6430 domain-containing protein [Roseburia sp.]|nr:DUF6430 domain-containing protein [Anaeroplasma bactoclasticum]MCM1196492.1 DUF6430 domain-containing protein [Roseburia sp.]MCM1556961.1 DUF6430 domain-containing protein [Anaeroplasma bactoclasticum]
MKKKMKIKFFNKYIYTQWSKSCAIVATVISTIFLFLPDFSCELQFIKYIVGILLLVFLGLAYIVMYCHFKRTRFLKLKINNTTVNVFFGDIFKLEGKKVIAFNEYFDTQVDDVIITHSSLHGQAIDNNYIKKKQFDKLVETNSELIKGEYCDKRKSGKKQKYIIGQIQPIDDYFALAFSKFTPQNEAYLHSNEYANCLLDMWKNLNRHYARFVVNIPLLGAGITRIIDNQEVTKQELLEIMLETLKISKMTFKEPSKINIVLDGGKDDENIYDFDFVKIREIFK